MKIGGIDPKTLPTEVFLVLPRGETQIVLRAVAVPSMDDFEALCPRPVPPGKMTREGWVTEENNPTYQQLLAIWAQQRLGYTVLQSLKPSQIEWDTVTESDPRSWKNWSTDLRSGGLNDVETQRVLSLVLEANCLDDAKLKQAREVFLRGQEQKSDSTGLPVAPLSTPSGAPVSA